MKPLNRFKTRFFLLSLAVFGFLAILTERQALVGKVPIPAELLGYFPPFESAHINMGNHHSEMGDSFTLFYPWRTFQAASLKQGKLPLWNPMILGGTPFLGENQSALFYPPHLLLYLLFSVPTAWTVGVLLNVMLAGTFTAWFVRSLGASRAGAVASGIIFSCCGFVAAWQLFSPLADGLVWLPFIFFAVHRLIRRPTFPRALLAAVGFTLPVLAGHPETAAQVILAGAAYALWECVFFGWTEGGTFRRLAWFSATAALSLGFAALQLIPTLEWLPYQSLSPDIRWPPRQLWELLAFFSRDISNTPNSAGFAIPEVASYAGALTLLLAPLALFYRKHRTPLFFVVLIVVSIQLVLQNGPVFWVVEHIPTLARMKNWRALSLIDFSLAVLAGLGITALSRKISVSKKYFWLVTILSCVGIMAGVRSVAVLTVSPLKWYRSPWVSALIAAVGFVLIAARLWNKVNGRAFAAAALLLITADMATFRSGNLPFVSRAGILPDVPVFRFLQSKMPSRYRIAIVDATLASNFPMLYGINEVSGYDVGLKLAGSYFEDFLIPNSGSFSAQRLVKTRDRRLDLADVRYIMTTTANESADLLASDPRFSLAFSYRYVRIYENRTILDRVRFLPAGPQTVEVVPESENQLARLKDPSFDAENRIILSALPDGWPELTVSNSPQAEISPPPPAAVDWTSDDPDESVFRLNQSGPGIIEVGQIFYPGWRAYADGEEVPVVRADYGLVAIPLAKGAKTVRFVYDPLSFRIGVAITIVTILLCAGIFAARAFGWPRFGGRKKFPQS